MSKIRHSDLFVVGGKVYHLEIGADMFSPNVIICGTPGRVRRIGEELLTDVRFESSDRGMTSVLGTFVDGGRKTRVLATTGGMGTGSTSICLDEIEALNEIDLVAMERRPIKEYKQLRVIRVGTSGALQTHTKTGTMMIAAAGLGLDNSAQFLNVPLDPQCRVLMDMISGCLNNWMPEGNYFKGKMTCYAAWSDKVIVEALQRAAAEIGVAYETGVTVTAPTLYAGQGHNGVSRIEAAIPDLDYKLGDLGEVLERFRLINFEMETSLISYVIGALGYQAGAVCLAIDNRRFDEVCADPRTGERNTALCALKALAMLDQS